MAEVVLCSLHLFIFKPKVNELVKFLVKFLCHILVEVEVHHATLVIHRSCSSVLHRLCHVIHVDVIAKHLSCVLLSGRDRSACKSYETCPGQCLSHLQCHTLLHHLLLGIPCLFAILRAVSLVGHHDDILPIRKRFVALGEFLYSGEYYSSAFSFLQ